MLWARATGAVRESAGALMIATAMGTNKTAERVMGIERGTDRGLLQLPTWAVSSKSGSISANQ